MLGKVLSTWQTIKGAIASAFIVRITIFLYDGPSKDGKWVAGNHHGLDGANCSEATSHTCAIFSSLDGVLPQDLRESLMSV